WALPAGLVVRGSGNPHDGLLDGGFDPTRYPGPEIADELVHLEAPQRARPAGSQVHRRGRRRRRTPQPPPDPPLVVLRVCEDDHVRLQREDPWKESSAGL